MLQQLAISAAFLFSALPVILGQGTWVINGGSLNANAAPYYGYVQSDGYAGQYSPYAGWWFQFNLNNPNSEAVHLEYDVYYWDGSTGDSLTVQAYQYGTWYTVLTLNYASPASMLSSLQTYGDIRMYWSTDGSWNGNGHWHMKWSFHPYTFGCGPGIFQNPNVFQNTTQYGVVKSPFFPAFYSINMQCTSIIDVDQFYQNIALEILAFQFSIGDTLAIYVGDAQAGYWTQLSTWSSSNPMGINGEIMLYGVDVKIVFQSDAIGCEPGFLIHWHTVPNDRYAIYKQNTLTTLWPMTAAHFGNDIVAGCQPVAYPDPYPGGSIQLTTSPTGDGGAALYLQNSSLTYTSAVCQAATTMNGSFSMSLFTNSATTARQVLAVWLNGYGVNLQTGCGGTNQLCFATAETWVSSGTSGSYIQLTYVQNSWQFITAVYDQPHNTAYVYRDGVQLGSFAVTAGHQPNAAGGLTFGYLSHTSSSIASSMSWTGIPMIGSLGCIAIYAERFLPYDASQVKAMCQNMQKQYGLVFQSNLIGFWPLTNLTNLQDISGFANHGTASSSAVTLATGPTGLPNTAYALGATNNAYINIPGPVIPAGSSFTWSFFVYKNATIMQPILEYVPIGGNSQFQIWFFSPSNTPNTLFINPVCSGCASGYSYPGVQSQQWNFISVTYNAGNGQLLAYRDGALLGTASLPASRTMESTGGFNLGLRSSSICTPSATEGCWLTGQMSCLSLYNTVLSSTQIGQVKDMCHRIIADATMRDQTRPEGEFNCDFEMGWCGWTQDQTTDTFDWSLGHLNTPTGLNPQFRTGPNFGKSMERRDALDQYAFINSNSVTAGSKARLLSPSVSAGWHCVEFWYFMGGYSVSKLTVGTIIGNTMNWQNVGLTGNHWRFNAIAIFVVGTQPGYDQIYIDAYAGGQFGDIAIDDVKISEGQCNANVKCPAGWLDGGLNKCYFPFTETWYSSGCNGKCASRFLMIDFCFQNMKARLLSVDSAAEQAYLTSLLPTLPTGPGTAPGVTYINTGVYSISAGHWGYGPPTNDGAQLPNLYLMNQNSAWATGYPTTGDVIAVISANGMVTLSDGGRPFMCEVYKKEIQHLGLNCTFDGKHMCGWITQTFQPGSGLSGYGSPGMFVGSSIYSTWGCGNWGTQCGPDNDYSQGNNRGYYSMLNDISYAGGGNGYLIVPFSPIIKASQLPACFKFRFMSYGNNQGSQIQVYYANMFQNIAYTAIGLIGGNYGPGWQTAIYDLESPTLSDIIIQMNIVYTYGTSGTGPVMFDNFEITPGTCTETLLRTTLPNRPAPGYPDSVDQPTTDSDFTEFGSNDVWRWTGNPYNGWTLNSGPYNWNNAYYQLVGPLTDLRGASNYISADCPNQQCPSLSANSTSAAMPARLGAGPAVAPGQHCFIFHSFQNGYDSGELRVFDTTGKLWYARQGPQIRAWQQHKILVNSKQSLNFMFEATYPFFDMVFNGTVYNYGTHTARQGGIMLDDIWVRNGTSTCLGFMDCNFEGFSDKGIRACGWQQNDTDDADWVVNSGETPARNRQTGPVGDHTAGLGFGNYLYMDATHGRRVGAKARIHMPPTASGTFCLSFWYYMFGNSVGSLRVFYVPQVNISTLGGNFSNYTETTLWQQIGPSVLGNTWVRELVPLNFNYSQILTFEGVRGNGDDGDIAIDDVVLLQGNCPMDRGVNCSFERGDFCGWYSSTSAGTLWNLNQGKTPNAPVSGPEGDNTGAYAGGHYAYLNSQAQTPGTTAVLQSPSIIAGTYCFRVYYNMRGIQMGSLSVSQSVNGISSTLMRVRSAATPNSWRRMAITVASNTTFSLQITGVVGLSMQSDIGIDDISLAQGPCPGTRIYNYNVGIPTTTAIGSHYLNNHNLILLSGITSVQECVALCQQNSSCLSVNYDSSSLACRLNNAIAELDPINLGSASSTTVYVGMMTPFVQNQTKLQNLCSFDNPTCTPTGANCTSNTAVYGSNVLLCPCVQGNTSCFMPIDCDAVLQWGLQSNGSYLIQPQTTSPGPFMARCEMDLVNYYGWTVLVNRFNGAVRFHDRYYREYINEFGHPDGEYWIGLENMHQLTGDGQNYGFGVFGRLGTTSYSEYGVSSPITFGANSTFYQLALQALNYFSGSGSSGHNWGGNPKFGAIDIDNSPGTENCMLQYSVMGGSWYTGCFSQVLTATYTPYYSSPYLATFVGDFSPLGLTSVKWSIRRI